MKLITIVLVFIHFVSISFGQTAADLIINGSLDSSKIKKQKRRRKLFGFRAETAIATVRDSRSNIVGNSSYYRIEPDYFFTRRFRLAIGTQYRTREATGELKSSESSNRDHLETIYFNFRWEPTRFRDNGISDLRFQFRGYKDQDDFYNRRYGSDGNLQLRAFFGRPLGKNWQINRFISYLRYKKYYRLNDYTIGSRTRDYELRARVSPTYSPAEGIDLGITTTYNHIFKVRQINDEENVNLGLSARFAWDNWKYAILFISETNVMDNEGGKTALQRNENAGDNIGHSATFTVFL